MANTGMLRRLASFAALASFCTSTTNKAAGRRVRSAIDPRFFSSLARLAGDLEFFSLGKVIVGTVGRIFVDGSHFLDGFAYGREVRKHTARPAFGHIRHIHGGNRLRHDILGLLLRRYEEYR